MNKTYLVITTIFSLLLTGIVMATLDKVSIVYAKQQDNNIMEVGSSNTTNPSKANATETAAASATKAKASETPYAVAIAKLQPGGLVKYCYSYS